MLYREDYYAKQKKNHYISELILAKQRNGPTDSIKLIFDPKIVSFSNFVLFY
jgi:replicative DNA helicase